MGRSVTRYAIPIAARYGSIALQFGVVAIITRALNQHDAGQYFVIMGLVWSTYFAAGCGLPDGVVRCAPALAATGGGTEAISLISKVLRLSMGTVPVGAFIIGCAVAVYSGSAAAAILAALWWTSYGTIAISAQVLVASGLPRLGTSMFYSAASVGLITVTAPAIIIGQLRSLQTVLLATAIGTLSIAAVCLIVSWMKCGRAARGGPSIREAWRQGVVIASGRVVQSAFLWSPVWVTSLILSASEAALVGLSARLVAGVAAVIAAVRFSIRPSLARDAAQGKWRNIESHSSRVALYATILAILAIGVSATVGDTLIGLLFGNGYSGAGFVTALMLIGTFGESFGGPVDEVLRMSGHVGEVVLLQLAILIIGFVAELLLARAGGLVPLLVAYGISLVLLYWAYIWRVWRLHSIVVLPRFV